MEKTIKFIHRSVKSVLDLGLKLGSAVLPDMLKAELVLVDG